MTSIARRMFELIEPVGVIPYSADEPNEAMFALGFSKHRGDGHIAALMVEGVGLLEAHVLLALAMDMPAEKFGRIHHLPSVQIGAVVDVMRARGVIGDDGWLSEQGRAVKQRVELLTDDLAVKPYECLEPGELNELTGTLEPLAKV